MKHDLPPETPRPTAKSRAGRRAVPPWWMCILLIVVGAAAVVVRTTEVIGDHAAANVASMVMGYFDVASLLGWFVFFSGYSRAVRWAALVLCLAALAAFFALFRIDRVSGELIPSFVYRYGLKHDQRLELPVTEEADGRPPANVDLRTTTADDFPQFLGPRRDASLDGPALAHDAAARPPQRLWRREVGGGWSGFAVVNGHAVTMEQRGDLEMVTCYDLKTGVPQWAHSTPTRFDTVIAGVGPRSTPTIDEGMVYALGATGHLLCLDGASGRCVWEKNLLQQYGISPEDEAAELTYGRSNSPLVVGELLIVPAGGHRAARAVSLAAFDKRTGKLVWEGGQRQVAYASPAPACLAGMDQVLIVNEDYVSGHDVKTGKVLWEYFWPGQSHRDANVSQAVPLPPDRVFLSKGYGRGAALLQLKPNSDGSQAPEVLWQNVKVLRTKFTNVVIRDGYIYGLSDGILECVELTTGQRVWKEGRYQHGQLLRVADQLIVLSESGEVVLVEATPERPNSVLGRFQAIEGMTWNTIALSGPYLLVRNGQEAACYRLPREAR